MSIKKLKTDNFTMNTIVKKRRRHVGEHQTVCGLWTPQRKLCKWELNVLSFPHVSQERKKNNGKEERDMARVMECVEAIAEMDSEEVLGSSDQQSLREG